MDSSKDSQKFVFTYYSLTIFKKGRVINQGFKGLEVRIELIWNENSCLDLYMAGNVCRQICPHGQYPTNSTCSTCYDSCLTCTGIERMFYLSIYLSIYPYIYLSIYLIVEGLPQSLLPLTYLNP